MAQAGNSAGLMARALRTLRPSHQHSAFSATVLVMGTVMLSRVIGFLREAYVAKAFGATTNTDALYAAFMLPDFINYLLAGAAMSITFVAIVSKYEAEGREAEMERGFSIIVTFLCVLLAVMIGLAEVFTYPLTRFLWREFSPEQLALCVHLTRIMLPMQACFVIGGVLSGVLLAKKRFLTPSIQPLIYNIAIIAGGILLARRLGVASLAWGALVGAFAGAFAVNLIALRGTGVRYRVQLDLRDPVFRDWLWRTIPLMVGVSLVTADDWIMRLLAQGGAGDISRLNYAKRLFQVPIAVVGQAVGQASLPFFARLFSERRFDDFAATVNRSVYRVTAASALIAAWMMSVSLPLTDIVFRFFPHARFRFIDSRETAVFLFWFSLSLAFWASQGLYSRAFYAANDTFTPMLASTIVTVLSIPVYTAMFHTYKAMGLTIASDIGIAAQTIVVAWLLHRRGMVRLDSMPWRELAKVVGTAAFAFVVSWLVGRSVTVSGSRLADLEAIALKSVTWAAAVALGLWITRSDLPRALRRK